jgi:hypothetical protein
LVELACLCRASLLYIPIARGSRSSQRCSETGAFEYCSDGTDPVS